MFSVSFIRVIPSYHISYYDFVTVLFLVIFYLRIIVFMIDELHLVMTKDNHRNIYASGKRETVLLDFVMKWI